MELLEVGLQEINKDYWLRCDPQFHAFTKLELPSTLNEFVYPTKPFGQCIKSISNGKDIGKEDYSISETRYVYLSVNNIRKHEIIFNDIIYLNDDVGEILEKHKLQQGDLIVTRSGTVGTCKLFDIDEKGKVFIPSGYIVVAKLRDGLNKKFIESYLSLDFIERFLKVHAVGKDQQNISQVYIKRIPIPLVPDEKQNKTSKQIEEIEAKIWEEKKEIIPIQQAIDESFLRHGIKKHVYRKSEFETFTTDTANISKQKYLRCGARYRAFWDVHNGLLIEDQSDTPVVALDYVMKLVKPKLLKKGELDEDFILIELEDIQSKSGRIDNIERVVREIGSDKIYFGDCDLLTTKLRPYLGYTILNNMNQKLIGTTELLPFKLNKYLVYPEYVKYVLLSYEYLDKSEFLMYGKEHPRIHFSDLLKIRVPLPKREVQRDVITEIEHQESINHKAESKIAGYRQDINQLLSQLLLKT